MRIWIFENDARIFIIKSIHDHNYIMHQISTWVKLDSSDGRS